MKQLLLLLILLTTSYSKFFKVDELGEIVTYPLFKEEDKSLTLYLGIENLSDKKSLKNTLLKIDVKSGKKQTYTLSPEGKGIEYDIKGNLREIFYKNQECIVVTVGNSDFSQIMIFDKELHRLQNILLKWELKDSPIVFDVNNDNLLDMLVQTDEKVYILKQNINNEFELIENKIVNKSISDDYRIFAKHPNPVVIDYEDKKYLMLNYSKRNIKTFSKLKGTYIDFYEIKSNGTIEKLRNFVDEKITNDSTLKAYSNREKELKYILPIVSNAKVLVGSFNENSYIKNLLLTVKENTLFSNVFQTKVFSNGGSNYYAVFDSAKENLIFINLDSEIRTRVVPNYKPYESYNKRLNSLPLGIDFSILNEKGKFDIYVNSKDNSGNLLLLEPTKRDIIIDKKYFFEGRHKDTYKYIIGQSNNKTYIIGFGKLFLETKEVNLNREFANLKYYNEFFSSSNYLYLGNIDNLINFNPLNFFKILERVNILTSLVLDKNLEKIKSTLNEYSFIKEKINFLKDNKLKDINIEAQSLKEFLEKLNEELNLRVENKLIKELKNKSIFDFIKKKDEIKNIFFDCQQCNDFSIFLNDLNDFIIENSIYIYQKKFFNMVNKKTIFFLKSGNFDIEEIRQEYIKLKKEEELKLTIEIILKSSIVIIFYLLLYLFYKKKRKLLVDRYKYILIQVNVINLLRKTGLNPIKKIPVESFEEVFKSIDYIHSTLMYKLFTIYAKHHGESYYEKILKIFQKRLSEIDSNNRILIHNILKATRDKDRKVYNLENDQAFKLSIQLLTILSKTNKYKSFWRVVEQISLYISSNEKISCQTTQAKKAMFLTEINFLKKKDDLLTIYFIKNYKIDEENRYSFQEKSKLLSLLYPFYKENHLSDKIRELNNQAFEKEGLSCLKDRYIITTKQRDSSILKTFLAFDFKSGEKKAIRYFDKSKDYLINVDNLFEYKIANISFVKYYKPMEGENYIVSIEDKSNIETSFYKLVKDETLSPLKVKDIIKRLGFFFVKLEEDLKKDGKEFDFLPNIFSRHIFYDMESDRIEVICSQHDKLKIDLEIVNDDKYEKLHCYFQTPEYRNKPEYYAYNITSKDLGNQLVYYLGYLLYFGLNGKYPFKRENKIKHEYSVANIYNVKEKEQLLLLLNKLFTSKIEERINLKSFIEAVHKIYFYNINPFYAGTMLQYERNRSIFVGRTTELKKAKTFAESIKDKIIAIQANRRVGKSSFCSYLYYELEKDRKYFVTVLLNGADWEGKESLYYFLANAIYQKLLHYSHIFIEAPNKDDFLNSEFELDSFIYYITNIIEKYDLTCNFIIDEFESYLIKAYEVRGRDYLNSFKSLADRLERFNIFIVSSINFKVARKIHNLPIGNLLNIENRFTLKLLSFENTEKLLNNEIIKRDKIEFDESVIKAIYDVSKGHPFFTQIYAKAIIEEKNERGDRSLILKYEEYKEFIDKHEETLFGEMSSLFIEFWKLFTEKEKELIYLIIRDKEIERVKYLEEIETLLSDDILEQLNNKKLYFKVPIFERWLKSLLLEEE